MIKFNFKKYQDDNGFVRLKDVPGFGKFIKTWEKMTTYVSTDPYSTLYKDYSKKITYSFANGVYNFSPMSNAEVYFKRIVKYLPIGYVILSILKKDGKRDNEIYFVYNFDYTNKFRAPSQTVVVKAINSKSNFVDIEINASDLNNLVFKILNEKEIAIYKEYLKVLNSKASPIYQVMVMKQSYKDDYDKYLADCEKFRFTPLDKNLISKINIENDGIPVAFSKNGNLFGNPYADDLEVMNAQNN